MLIYLFQKIRFVTLEHKIKKNPYIGKEDSDGTYNYKQGSYSIRYRIVKQGQGKESVEWISQRRRLSAYGEGLKRIKHRFFKFRHYQGWLVFFHPPILFLVLFSILIFYFGLMETQETKIERYKWLVASIAGVDPGQIQYIGDGWLEIPAQRKTAVDKINEPVQYTFNPFRWLFSSEAGFVTRWRGEPYGSATHPVVYNERGDVWINKENEWQHGNISANTIKWDIPQGTGIRARKVTGHEISTQDKELRIKDK